MSDHQAQLKKAMQHLQVADPVLAPVIARFGPPTFTPHTDYYWELVDSIISQQLSMKAAHTIEQRFLDLFGGKVPQPKQLLNKTVDELRAVGMSGAKAKYVLDLARHIDEGLLVVDRLPNLPNDEIVRELVAVKGIGEWTAHMFMIFALGRLDILPIGDLGIKNGVQKLYNLPAVPTAADLTALAAKNNWHPYESVASWYVWQSLTK
jgi:DNA-3-methyladenine glycosylase II